MKDEDNPLTTNSFWENASVCHSAEELHAKGLEFLRAYELRKKPRPVSVRLAPDVVSAFKETGKGWQSRLNLALSDWLKTHKPMDVAL
jgi:uncharacterized protein (DUF4415 family)